MDADTFKKTVHVWKGSKDRPARHDGRDSGLGSSLCLICVFAYGIKITKKLTSDENPFNAENAVLLRRGALLIGVSAVPKVIFTAASAIQEGCSWSVALFSAVSAALILILVSIFLSFLYQVFAYGSELQQLSDATL